MPIIREIYGRITEYLTAGTSSLTRYLRVTVSRFSSRWNNPTHDWSRPDYQFWRLAYYGRARGLELSGLFLKPLCNKLAAWTLGRPPHWKTENETSGKELATWWSDRHAEILKAYRASLRQGDAFVVVNADTTLTLVPPDWVEPMVSDDDYSEIIGWRITQTVAHPTRTADKMVVIDEYTAAERVHRVEVRSQTTEETRYPNLIGRIPVIHVANGPDDGETFGHPEAEALVEALHRYGEVIEAGIDGNKVQGRPTPVISFDTVQDLDKFWELYGETETQELPDGTTERTITLAVDLNQVLTLSGNASFSYEAPGSFSADTVALLEMLFYLILEHTEIPEFVFGNAISSSKASAETQMPVFIRFVEMKQGEAAAWLTELSEVVLAYLALTVPGVVAESPTLQWESLSQQDGRLTLDSVMWAFAEGLLDEETALMLAPVDIEDIAGVLDDARAERAGRFPEAAEPSEDDQLAVFRDEVNRLENPDVVPANLESTEGLNGIQIRAAIELLEKVSMGDIPPANAVELLVALGIGRERAEFMVANAERFVLKNRTVQTEARNGSI